MKSSPATLRETTSAGERLVFLREMCQITRRDFSNVSKISYSSIKHWENANSNTLKLEVAEKIVNTFEHLGIKCSTNWLIHGVGEPPYFIASIEKYSSKVIDSDSDDGLNSYREVEFFRNINKNSVSLILTDMSMSPFFEPGDIVAGIKKQPEEIQEKALNRVCIIESTEGIKLVRRILPGSLQGKFNLEAINELDANFPLLFDISLLYAAPVIWHRKKDI